MKIWKRRSQNPIIRSDGYFSLRLRAFALKILLGVPHA